MLDSESKTNSKSIEMLSSFLKVKVLKKAYFWDFLVKWEKNVAKDGMFDCLLNN
jgi:hypothetical protein